MSSPRHSDMDAAAAPLWARRPESIPELLTIYTSLCERLAGRRADGNPYVDSSEYLAAATSACWEAIRRFDPGNSKGAAASTYLSWRVGFELIETERSHDWVRPKTRIAARDGRIHLPGMEALRPEIDLAVDDAAPTSEDRLAALMGRADVVVRALAGLMLDAGHDAVVLAERLGCSAEFAGYVMRWVVGELQQTPAPV